jgi:prephenate dehydrogenase
MNTVAIVGTGLIGASFGLALKSAGFGGRILGVSSPPAIKDAFSRGAIDEAVPLQEAVAAADLVFLSQTIDRILSTLPLIAPCLRSGALVTDAGSTKTEIVNRAASSLAPGQFLGGHPMAGKEQRGAAHACADLFRYRTWILTPTAPGQLESPAAAEFAGWIGKIGALPLVLSPGEHDRVVALTSHLPQLLSTALAATLGERLSDPEHFRAGGPGLADMTRLAGSSYEIWREILATNASAIDSALAACIAKLEALRSGLTSEETRRTFESAAEFSSKLRK